MWQAYTLTLVSLCPITAIMPDWSHLITIIMSDRGHYWLTGKHFLFNNPLFSITHCFHYQFSLNCWTVCICISIATIKDLHVMSSAILIQHSNQTSVITPDRWCHGSVGGFEIDLVHRFHAQFSLHHCTICVRTCIITIKALVNMSSDFPPPTHTQSAYTHTCLHGQSPSSMNVSNISDNIAYHFHSLFQYPYDYIIIKVCLVK